MGKLPGFTFFPGDWWKDPDLRRCSKAAKGVWIDMLCLMFECEDRGVFQTDGRPWLDEEIAAAVGGDIAENLSCIAELLAKGVASRNKFGSIFSRRMTRDERERQETKGRVRRYRKRSCNADVTPMYGNESEDVRAFEVDVGSKKTKPSLEEVESYCRERGNTVSPQQFFDYYTANGWKVGKNAMKDWRAAVRTWERNGFANGKTAARLDKTAQFLLKHGVGVPGQS